MSINAKAIPILGIIRQQYGSDKRHFEAQVTVAYEVTTDWKSVKISV